MPMHEGALQACLLLHQAGYELVCVTTMPARFIDHRLENLRSHGFPIDKVISTVHDKQNVHYNPKKEAIEELHPVVFVDDIRRNFKDIQGVHTKLIFIDHEYDEHRNQHDDVHYDAKYPNLLAFVEDFLKTEQHGQDIIWPARPSHLLSSS
jgi:hypothetical protein